MDNVTRREALVGATAVVGLAALGAQPSAAHNDERKEKATRLEGSEFILKLSGIKLPHEVEKRVAAELQGSLLRELAKVDLKGELALHIPDIGWLGIWIDLAKGGRIPVLRATEVAR